MSERDYEQHPVFIGTMRALGSPLFLLFCIAAALATVALAVNTVISFVMAGRSLVFDGSVFVNIFGLAFTVLAVLGTVGLFAAFVSARGEDPVKASAALGRSKCLIIIKIISVVCGCIAACLVLTLGVCMICFGSELFSFNEYFKRIADELMRFFENVSISWEIIRVIGAAVVAGSLIILALCVLGGIYCHLLRKTVKSTINILTFGNPLSPIKPSVPVLGYIFGGILFFCGIGDTLYSLFAGLASPLDIIGGISSGAVLIFLGLQCVLFAVIASKQRVLIGTFYAPSPMPAAPAVVEPIASAAGTVICGKCGQPCASTNTFCDNCGSPLGK